MKYTAALFLVVILALATFPKAPMGQAQVAEDTPGMFGHTPIPKGGAPAAASPGAKGPVAKVPLTASLAKDEKGKQPASVFSKSDPEICLKWTGGMGSKGDKVRVVWVAVDTGGAITKNKKLTESSMTLAEMGQPGSSYISAPKGGFPAGSYRVDVYEGSKVSKSLKFTVK